MVREGGTKKPVLWAVVILVALTLPLVGLGFWGERGLPRVVECTHSGTVQLEVWSSRQQGHIETIRALGCTWYFNDNGVPG